MMALWAARRELADGSPSLSLFDMQANGGLAPRHPHYGRGAL
jgi:hypothetical protein